MKKFIFRFAVIFILLVSAQVVHCQTTILDSNNRLIPSALAADSVWNGNYVDLIQHNTASITIAVYSDSASATNGMKVYFSPNGITPYDSLYFTVSAGADSAFILTPLYQYYKIQYTNGSKATHTTFIQPILRTASKGF